MSGHKPWSEIEHKSEAKRKSVERAQTDEFIRDAAMPSEAMRRKGIPVYSGFFKYFPDAILAVAELSRIGNDQHNPGSPLHWDRSKSADELDAMLRHVLDDVRGEDVDSDGVLHKTKVAWRAMADLQKALENQHEIDAISEEVYLTSRAKLDALSDRIKGERRPLSLDQEWVSKVSRETEGDENSKSQKFAPADHGLWISLTTREKAQYIERLNIGWNAL